jgi:hypothetical protein
LFFIRVKIRSYLSQKSDFDFAAEVVNKKS